MSSNKPAKRGRAGQTKTFGIRRPTEPFVGPAKGKGRFRTLLSVCSNFAPLKLYHRGNATGASTWVIYIPATFVYTYYIIRYSECVELYSITRRGLACVAYSYDGAMREPDSWDKHGGIDSHVFFISTLTKLLIAEAGRAGRQEHSVNGTSSLQ